MTMKLSAKPSRTPFSFVRSLLFVICLASLALKSKADCSSSTDCTNAAKPYCSSGTCVECTSSTQCDSSYSEARCASNSCTGCTSDSQCSKFSGRTQCGSGTCYQCVPGDNSPCTSVSASQCSSYQCSSCTSDSGCSHLSYKYCATYSSTNFCGVCKSDDQCTTSYSSARCVVNYLNSYCTSCSTNTNCAHFDRNLYCSSGNCIQCYTNYECRNYPSSSRCVSGTINTCSSCIYSSDCSYVTGLPICISGTCYECQYDSHCSSISKAYCNSNYVCEPCISDDNCAHFSPLKYCALDTVCKKIKVNITSKSSDRIIPEKLISYQLTMATYPVDQTLSFSWNLSESDITINQQTQYLLAINCFGKNVPLPTSVSIGYSISDSSSAYDSLIITVPVNRAPNGGLVSVTPTTGVGLSTQFTLKAQSWIDGDGDTISYKFYFAVDKDKKYIPLNDFQTATTLATLLPSGAFDKNSTFYIKVAAVDAYGIENYAETSLTVTLSQQSISDVLTNLQNQVISPVLAASFIYNIENEIMSSPLLGCPTCSYHGSCSSGSCVCDTGYVLSGCELSQTDFNNLVSVKTAILTQINAQISNYGVTEFLAEQSFAITRLTTYYLELTNTNFISQTLTLINKIMNNAYSQNVSLHLAALTDAAQTTENLFKFTTQDCKEKQSITTTIQNYIIPLFQSLPAIDLKMRNSTDPYIIDTDQFYICIQQGVLASNLKGESFYCGVCLVSLPSAGISASDSTYVNIQLIIPKTTFSDCDPSSFSFSPYQIYFTKLGDKSTSYTASGTVTVTFPISLGLSCTTPYEAAQNSTGDLNCVIISDDSLNSLIKDSNLFKITNISALKDFDVLHSPLFYVVTGFSLMMLIVSLWSIYKDRQLDRDLLKLPNKSPSPIYRMLVYISICHTFFGIFVLFDAKQPRIMRSVLFYLKILGLMTLSTIFNQTAKDIGTVKKTAISMITLVCLTPINGIIAYLVFKRNIEPKVRRKRAAVQTRKAQLPIENKQLEELKEKRKKRFTKIFNVIGYSSVILIILIYIYIIFVVTANNVQTISSVVEKWMLGFLQSTAMDFFGVQIIKAIVHLGIISTLQNENKKKFLCIPRKHLPRMVNANIWDFKKRFAVLDSLYSKNGKLKAEVQRTQTENLTSLGPATLRTNNVNAAILGRPGFEHLNTLSGRNDTSALDTFQENSFMDRSTDVMLEAKFSFQNSQSPALQRNPSNIQSPALQRVLSNVQSPALHRTNSNLQPPSLQRAHSNFQTPGLQRAPSNIQSPGLLRLPSNQPSNTQLDTLESQLEERKRARSLSIRKLQRNRKIIMGNQLMTHAQAQGHENGNNGF